MVADDFVMTINSDDEDIPTKSSKSKDLPEDTQLNPDFTFDLHGDPYADLLGNTEDIEDMVKTGTKPVRSEKIHSL